ncbi:DUF759 family protein [Borrelia miyamotoi]
MLQIITWTRSFDLKKDIINPITDKIKSIFSFEYFLPNLNQY